MPTRLAGAGLKKRCQGSVTTFVSTRNRHQALISVYRHTAFRSYDVAICETFDPFSAPIVTRPQSAEKSNYFRLRAYQRWRSLSPKSRNAAAICYGIDSRVKVPFVASCIYCLIMYLPFWNPLSALELSKEHQAAPSLTRTL